MKRKVPSRVVLSELRIDPQKRPRLDERDTGAVPGFDLAKKDAPDALAERVGKLNLLQQRLHAESSRALLVVLQGIDTAGKDGAIKNVFRGITPSATQVVSFKAPTSTELAHDYLWRIHHVVPDRGRIGLFNRSHYEDIVAALVRGIVSKSHVDKRYGHINDFERMLDDEGTRVVKIFLHLSEDEQKERLQARLDDPEKRWKFRVGDLDDRALWPKFADAYEDAIAATSTERAPWFVVPADRKWLRDVAVAEIVAETLGDMDPKLPPDDPAISGLVIE